MDTATKRINPVERKVQFYEHVRSVLPGAQVIPRLDLTKTSPMYEIRDKGNNTIFKPGTIETLEAFLAGTQYTSVPQEEKGEAKPQGKVSRRSKTAA